MVRIIEELTISEFREIRKLIKPIELGDFNVIIGRNNTGKSAILEALYLLSSPFTAHNDPIFGKPRFTVLADLHGGNTSLIYGYAGEATIIYRICKIQAISIERIELKLRTDGVLRVRFDIADIGSSHYESFLKTLGIDPKRNMLCLYIPNDSDAYRKICKTILSEDIWSWIVKKGLHRKVINDLLITTIYDKFTEVIIERGKLKLRSEVEGDIGPLYIDIYSLGEGVKRAILTYLAI